MSWGISFVFLGLRTFAFLSLFILLMQPSVGGTDHEMGQNSWHLLWIYFILSAIFRCTECTNVDVNVQM